MKVVFLRWFWLLGVCCLTGLCRGADDSQFPEKELAQARRLYEVKCGKCHEAHDVKKYKVPDWEKWMQEMYRKARLTSSQADSIKRYNDHLRSQPDKNAKK